MTLARTCLTCGSSNVQSLSMVHASGTTHTQTSGTTLTSTTYGEGQSSLGVGSYQGSSIHQSTLAASAAPPDTSSAARRREVIKLWAFAVWLFGGIAVIGLLTLNTYVNSDATLPIGPLFFWPSALALGISLIGLSSHKAGLVVDERNDLAAQPIYESWTRSYLCLSCGAISVTPKAGTQVPPKVATPPIVIPPVAQELPVLRVANSRITDLGIQVMSHGTFAYIGENRVRFTQPGKLLRQTPQGEWEEVGSTPVEVQRPRPGTSHIYGLLSNDGHFYASLLTYAVANPLLPPEGVAPPKGWQCPAVPATAAVTEAPQRALAGSETDAMPEGSEQTPFLAEEQGKSTPVNPLPDLDRLAQLGQLKKEGLLTDEEFIKLKGHLLGS